MLLAPRDYLSTFMKLGTIALLAIGIVLTLPVLENERFTEFASNGEGPVFAGSLVPFVFIVIACGALSGFHSLIASGTTPKMIETESQVRTIGYGAMLMESFVAATPADREAMARAANGDGARPPRRAGDEPPRLRALAHGPARRESERPLLLSAAAPCVAAHSGWRAS